jgi:hypothetical protein
MVRHVQEPLGMAAKKLAPHAKKLANPKVRVDERKPTGANRDYETDARGPADRDGNTAQARQRGAAKSGRGQAPARPAARR